MKPENKIPVLALSDEMTAVVNFQQLGYTAADGDIERQYYLLERRSGMLRRAVHDHPHK